MAFHLACPLTCRKICYCTLGAPALLQTWEGRRTFLQNAAALERLLSNPSVVRGGEETVDVLVPRLSKESKKKKQKNSGAPADREVIVDSPFAVSKRSIIRRKVTVSSIAVGEAGSRAELAKKSTDAGKFGAARELAEVEALLKTRGKNGRIGAEELEGILGVIKHGPKDGLGADDYLQPLPPQVVCGLCSSVEIVGSERERRMLSCHGCAKKYHRKCVKQWAEDRDLFNWASWICASCRSCEVCKRTGEPNKLMFCKRCDGALHVYCQQPPLKHVPKGPYLCPKHTCCHSCGSHVPGSGVSSRWFMSYTTCDACGRLFMKDKYCPVCLKVYRDSEATPMVCCDSCEHWVHCRCDGISDEKFNQYQTDYNLRYKCAACRGDCHKVQNIDDAVGVLWKRRDENDAQQRAELRAAAGLPSEEEMQKLCPSDDEKQPPANTQATPGSKKASKSKKKTVKKDMRDDSGSGSAGDKQGEVEKKVTMQKNILKIMSSSTGALVEMPKKPKLIIKGLKYKSRSPTELVELTPDTAEEIDGNNLHETLKVFEDVQLKALKGKKAVDIEHQSDQERNKDKKRAGFGLVSHSAVAVDLVGSDDVSSGVRNKRLKIVDTDENTSTEVEVLTSGSGRSKNRKAGVRGGTRHPGVILELTDLEVPTTEAAALSDSSAGTKNGDADTEQLKDEGDVTGNSDGRDLTKNIASHTKQTSKGLSPIQSWGGHGHSESARRRRMPSSKFRDMEISVWRSSKGSSLNGNPDGEGVSEEPRTDVPFKEFIVPDQGFSDTPKESRLKLDGIQEVSGSLTAADDDSSEAPRKRMKVVDIGGAKVDAHGKQEDMVEGSGVKVPLRLKIKKQVGRNEVDAHIREEQDEEETSTVRGQRSKRRRPGAADVGEKEELGFANDNRILQRLGTDAVSKRVEVFWPMDNQWYKGTVIGVFPQKSQFALRYDDGEEETLDFGKERVRLLSSRK